MYGCRLRQGVTPEAKIQRGLLEKSIIIYMYMINRGRERMYGNMENILCRKVVR